MLSVTFALYLWIGFDQSALTADRVWVVGVEDTRYYPHYDLVDDRWVGFGAELLAQFAEDSGHILDIKPMPVERLFRSFIQNEIDFKYPSSPEWKKAQKAGLGVVYSDQIVGYIDGASILSANAGNDDIKTLGIVRGFTPVSWQDKIGSGEVTLIQTDSFYSLVLLALRGRVDAIYANSAVVQHLARELIDEFDLENTSLIFAQSLPYDKGAYRLATRHHPKMVEEFNQWMSLNTEFIDDLKNSYSLPIEEF